MEIDNIPAELYLLVAAIAVGIVAGYFHARMGKETKPIWPVRIWLKMFENHVETFRKYAIERTHFQFREQFVAASFVWFFIFFVLAIFLFEKLW